MKDEDQSEALIDRYEESNRIKFKEMFKNAAIYPSAYSIFKSEKLDLGLTKIKKSSNIFKHMAHFLTIKEIQALHLRNKDQNI